LVTLKFIAGWRVRRPSLIWATNLSPISCWKRTKRLGYWWIWWPPPKKKNPRKSFILSSTATIDSLGGPSHVDSGGRGVRPLRDGEVDPDPAAVNFLEFILWISCGQNLRTKLTGFYSFLEPFKPIIVTITDKVNFIRA
jgi:hypothetical protein